MDRIFKQYFWLLAFLLCMGNSGITASRALHSYLGNDTTLSIISETDSSVDTSEIETVKSEYQTYLLPSGNATSIILQNLIKDESVEEDPYENRPELSFALLNSHNFPSAFVIPLQQKLLQKYSNTFIAVRDIYIMDCSFLI